MELTNKYKFNGKTYCVFYKGISYCCPDLKIYGEKNYLTCKGSIAKKLKIKKSELQEIDISTGEVK